MADFNVRLILKAIDGASAPLRRLGGIMGGLAKRSKETQKQMKEAFALSAHIRQAAEGVATFSRRSRQLLKAPADEWEKFEHEMARVRGLTGATDEGFARLKTTAQSLGSVVGEFSALDAAKAMSEYGMAGFTVDQILKSTKTTLDLSTAAQVDLADTVGITTGIMGGFGLKADEIGRVANVLTATFTGSKTSLQSLGETMAYSGAVARAAGVSLEETATIAGLLGNASIEGSRAGTALNAILTRLAKPRGMASKAMSFIGVDPTEMRDGERQLKRPLALLDELRQKTAKLGSARRLAVLAAIFGQEAGPAVATLLGALGDSESIKTFSDRVTNSEGRLQQLAETMRSTSRNATLELDSAVNTLQLSLGEALAPTLDGLKSLVEDTLNALARWTTTHPKLTRAIMITVGTVAILSTVLAGLLFTLATLTGALGFGAMVFGVKATGVELLALSVKAIPKAIAGLGRFAAVLVTQAIPAAVKFSIALLANPIGLVVLALAALIGIVVLMVKHWDKLVGIWERFKNASLGTKIVLGIMFGPLVALLSPFLLLAWVVRQVVLNWDKINTSGNRVKALLALMLGPLSALLTPLLLLKDAFTSVWDSIESGVTRAIRKLAELWQAITDNSVVRMLLTPAFLRPLGAIEDVSGGGLSGVVRKIASGAGDIYKESAGVLGFGGQQNVGGTIRLEVSTPEGTQAKVRGMEALGPVDFEVDTGKAMVWAY